MLISRLDHDAWGQLAIASYQTGGVNWRMELHPDEVVE